MPSFNIARAGSDYPHVARNELPVGAIFKAIEGSNSLGARSYMNIGAIGTRNYSLNINNNSIASASNATREVAMVGKASYSRTFFEEGEQAEKRINAATVSDIFIVKGRVNEDDLPIAYGLLGHTDDDEYMAIDFNSLGNVIKFRSMQNVTVVGKFGVVGTEI